jgi:hypothetical protein
LFVARTQEALPALSNQNDEEAARDEKGPEIFILSLAQDTRRLLFNSGFGARVFGVFLGEWWDAGFE